MTLILHAVLIGLNSMLLPICTAANFQSAMTLAVEDPPYCSESMGSLFSNSLAINGIAITKAITVIFW
jgi:hypothetical protein